MSRVDVLRAATCATESAGLADVVVFAVGVVGPDKGVVGSIAARLPEIATRLVPAAAVSARSTVITTVVQAAL